MVDTLARNGAQIDPNDVEVIDPAAVDENERVVRCGGPEAAHVDVGPRTVLIDLLKILERHQADPLSYKIMDDEARNLLVTLRTVGVISAEQAFELLCHTNFEFDAAFTAKEKRKAFKTAKTWLKDHATQLTLDRRRGFYTVSGK